MRLKQNKLKEITGLSQSSAQARWFKDHFGINVPCDRLGPIITTTTFELLVAKGCGIDVTPKAGAMPRPELHLRGRK